MDIVLKLIYKLQRLCVYVSAFFMGLLAIFVFYEVVTRYVFNSPTIWTSEISSYMLQFIVFFSMGLLLIEGRHIRVTFLIERLGGMPRKILEVITILLIIPYAYVLAVYGYKYSANAFSLGFTSPTLLEVPMWIPYSFISICGVLLALAAFCSIMKIIFAESYDRRGGTN